MKAVSPHKKKSTHPRNEKAVEEAAEIYDYWNDPEFLAELNRRQREYRAGKSKVYTLPEALKKVRAALAKVSK